MPYTQFGYLSGLCKMYNPTKSMSKRYGMVKEASQVEPVTQNTLAEHVAMDIHKPYTICPNLPRPAPRPSPTRRRVACHPDPCRYSPIADRSAIFKILAIWFT